MLAGTIIRTALKKLVVVAGNKEPTDSQYAEGLEILNDLINSWSGNASMIYEEVRENLVIPAGIQSFTVGLTGNVVSGKPERIVFHTLQEGGIVSEPIGGWTGTTFCDGENPAATVDDDSGREYRLDKADVVQHGQFQEKYTVSRPVRMYYQNTYPNGTFHFNCTTDRIYTVILNSYKSLSEFPDLTTEVALPPYYEKALKDNLTIELAPQMCSANRITPLMLKSAEESKQVIIGRSIKLNASITELTGRGRGGSSHTANDANVMYGY